MYQNCNTAVGEITMINSQSPFLMCETPYSDDYRDSYNDYTDHSDWCGCEHDAGTYYDDYIH